MTERAPVVLLDPETHAALVETVVTVTPHHHAVLPTTSVQLGLGLAPLVRDKLRIFFIEIMDHAMVSNV